MRTQYKILLWFVFAVIYSLGFAPPLNPPAGEWYQQFMPPINGRPISDITFLDSLNGFAVTPYTANDTAYILKTTNGGDNWNIIFRGPTNTIGGFNRVQFLNLNIGYVCGNFLRKTANGGSNWFPVNTSGIFPMNMHVLNEDTIWLVDSDGLTGGVYRTTNGGASWDSQAAFGSSNPDRIYMYNGRLGFIARNSFYVRRTSDGGFNWTVVISGNDGILDMHFVDSLTGWKAYGTMKKTTDGGLTWVTQTLPVGGIIVGAGIARFSNINRDTIYGTGGYVLYPNNQVRGLLVRTVNGGENWLFQIPDTSIHIGQYNFIEFTDKRNGWLYTITNTGIHTTTGGDPVWLTGIKQVSSEVPTQFKLYQNYPNPFNPRTIISYELKSATGGTSYVKLTVYDITGKYIVDLVGRKQAEGIYEVDFSGNGLSSGIYFYQLIVNDKIIDTKKMILLK